MSKSSSKYRYLPAAAGVLVSLGGLGVIGGVQLASGSTSPSSVADRHLDLAANRGTGRTHAPVDLAAPSVVEAAGTSVLAAIVPPSTTLPPSTTTTAPRASTATAAAAGTGHVQTGGASYYAYKSGGCAHRSIPKGTVVHVTNVANGKSTTCVVNDRGPFVGGRIIDLDTSVFRQVASTSSGVFQARITW